LAKAPCGRSLDALLKDDYFSIREINLQACFLRSEKRNAFMLKGGVQFMYFITISELFGTDGDKIAQEVAKSLNYTYYGGG